MKRWACKCSTVLTFAGNGLKLFQVFGDSNKNGKMEDVQSIPASKKNWFISLFALDNKKADIDQGTIEYSLYPKKEMLQSEI